MKFAINYSPQSLQLSREGTIEVDLFKFPPWPDLLPDMRSVPGAYVHFDHIAGGGFPIEVDRAATRRWLVETETRFVNTHLAVSAVDFASDETISPETVIEKALAYVDYLGQHFGHDRVIVENLRYPMPGWNQRMRAEIVDPQVIGEIVRRSGCGFLLDVAHAMLACEGLGHVDAKAYMNALPVDALRELHVVGIRPNARAKGIRDDHFALTEDDWLMTEWAVRQIREGHWRVPEILAFEYGGVGERFAWRSEQEVIAEQAPRLLRLARSI